MYCYIKRTWRVHLPHSYRSRLDKDNKYCEIKVLTLIVIRAPPGQAASVSLGNCLGGTTGSETPGSGLGRW